MIRWLLYRFIPFYVLLTAVLAMVLLLTSETGLQWLWKQAQPHVPTGLSIDRVSGRLIGRIQVDGLSFSSDTLELEAQQAWVDWSPLALLRGRVQLNEVVLLGARINTRTAAEPAPPGALPERLPRLPDVTISALKLRDLNYLSDDRSVISLRHADAQAELTDQALQLRIAALDLNDYGRWQAQLSAHIAAQQITIRELTVQGLHSQPLYLAADGACPWPALDCDANLSWSALRWPLGSSAWSSPSGEAKLALIERKAHILLDAELDGEQIPSSRLFVTVRSPDTAGEWSVQGQWDQLPEPDRSGAAEPAQVKLDVLYNAASQKLKASLDLARIDFAAWAPQWPSSVNGQVIAQADLKDGVSAQLPAITLRGQLRDQPLQLSTSGAYAGVRDWYAKQLSLSWADAQLKGHVRRSQRWQGKLQLRAPDLGKLDNQLQGRIGADVEVSGDGALPSVDWTLDGDKIHAAGFDLSRLTSKGHISANRVNLTLEAEDLTGSGLYLEQLNLHSSGRLDNARSQLSLDEARAQGTLVFNSRWDNKTQRLKVELEQGEWRLGPAPRPPFMAWTAEPGARLSWSKADGVSLSEHCWRSHDASSCLRGRWDTQQASARLQLRGYNLKRLRRLLPPGSQVDGEVELDVELEPSALSAPLASLSLRTSAIQIATRQEQDDIPLLTLLPGQLKADARGLAVNARWDFPLQLDDGRPGGFNGEFQLDEQRAVDGRLRVKLDDLSVISAFVPEVLSAQGRVSGELRMSGQLDKPALGGSIELDDGRFHLDTPDIHLEQTRISLRGGGDNTLDLEASTRSGEGHMQVDGKVDWSGAKAHVNARVSGENLLAVDIPEARVLVSPDLALEIAPPRLNLTGRISVPRADIRPREISSRGAIAPDADQIIVGQDNQARGGLQVHSEVELVLGHNVHFEGLGLTTDLDGRLKTRMRPGRAATGEGDLRLRNGRYKAYGQNLEIERGRLIFSGGPLTEPGLDIKAYRQATTEIRAGVIVRGPLDKPQVSLYSEPGMRETDQLSYLVLGRAAEARSADDQAMLNNAALALGLKGGDFLAKRFKGTLGLDEVSIGTQPGEQANQASLVLGKYLSPDIYVSYGIGLFEPVYTFRLRYQLSSKWSLQTESGVESGGDLFYTIER